MTTRKTRTCTLDTLDEDLKAAIRAHGAKHGLDGIETDILMCCETISLRQKKGFWGGIRTTLSAVYVTPKWLVWADSVNQNDAHVSTAQLKQIHVSRYQNIEDDSFALDQGLNITGRFTDENKTGMAFIVLDSASDGQQFRRVLEEALSKALTNNLV